MRRGPFSARDGAERLRAATIVGLVLLPLLIGGLLTWGLSAPTDNLNRVTAAIVNDDVPMTVNDTTVPLGRQFAAGLMTGGSTVEPTVGAQNDALQNFTWILTNDKDAKSGLRDGRYAAVVTIPKTFSQDATSLSGSAADATQAHLLVETSPSAAFLDPALTEAVTKVATESMNHQLTAQYLDNVYAGFNTINDQIGQAASGATSLASGADSVSAGAQSLASGSASLASGLQSLDSGAASLATGLGTLSGQSQSLPGQTAQLAQGAGDVAAGVDALSGSLSAATASFAETVAQLCLDPGPGILCDRATAALASLQAASQGVSALSGGADQVAAGNEELADAMPELVDGIDESADGAQQVAAGAAQADNGAASLSSGATSLVDGAAQLDSGSQQLAQSLSQAVQQVPSYSDSDIANLAPVVAEPVVADQPPPDPGSQSVPLFCVFALWIGGIVIALARKAVPEALLLTAVSSLSITLRTVLFSAMLGAAQGLVAAPFLLLGLAAEPDQWLNLAALSVVAGAVFAIVNHGLAAAFGGFGRIVAGLAAVLSLGVGLASTVPPVFASIASALPTAPALAMLRLATQGDVSGAWLSAAGCALFAVLGAALVFAGVSSRRGVRLAALSGSA